MRALLLLLALLSGAAMVTPTASRGAPDSSPGAARAWRGKWIWTPGEPSPRNSYTYFRKTLDLASAPTAARLHLTADSRYQLFVNGAFAGRGPARSDRRWLSYDTWDVARQLRKGRNVIAVLVHHYGEWTFQYMKGRGGLIAELEGGGSSPLAVTDA